jgi:hypothetical protein
VVGVPPPRNSVLWDGFIDAGTAMMMDLGAVEGGGDGAGRLVESSVSFFSTYVAEPEPEMVFWDKLMDAGIAISI